MTTPCVRECALPGRRGWRWCAAPAGIGTFGERTPSQAQEGQHHVAWNTYKR